MDINDQFGGDAVAAEAAFVDGTHPALAGNGASAGATSARQQHRRHDSGSSAASSSSTTPRRALPRSPTSPSTAQDSNNAVHAPRRSNAANGAASQTGPKGVLADWHALNEAGVSATSNTGPKGVLKDYKSSQQQQQHPHQQIGLHNRPPSPTARMMAAAYSLDLDGHDSAGGEHDVRLLVGDEAARELYRRQRITELMGSGERKETKQKRKFGHLREIGFEQFVAAVEDEADDVAVVVHLYEPPPQDIEACTQLNTHLSSIARSYPRTKFLRALATDLDFAANAEEHALPTVLVYRGGELETSLIRFDQEWDQGTRSDVIQLLTNCDAISGSPIMRSRFDRFTDEDE
ncbi:BQ5605_C010g05952 [Microbotryum silenes-dioicae]|uniref:BQ5605_C010g05952 protein n=1 Tax=Microbotryum silenes-dioicae TaxID=796604 RepID=A0A2X0MB92_9BASI|nr:BQ5605_C010g05952 [Microbotryum silenes-dioicae]